MLCELLWGVGPHDIPNGEQWGSRMQEHGPPPPDRRVGCIEPGVPGCLGRSCGREGDLTGVSFASKATKEKRVSAVAFVGRDGGVMGLVEALVQEGLDRNSAE